MCLIFHINVCYTHIACPHTMCLIFHMHVCYTHIACPHTMCLIFHMHVCVCEITHCATHCGKVQDIVQTLRKTLWHRARRCQDIVQHSVARCNTVWQSATQCGKVQHSVARCNTECKGARHCQDIVQHIVVLDKNVCAVLCPHQRLLGGGVSTPVPLYYLICTIIPN